LHGFELVELRLRVGRTTTVPRSPSTSTVSPSLARCGECR
jgi:hypothetical protein